MESFKEFVPWAISPYSIALVIQVLGWILFAAKRRRAGLVALGAGFAVLLIGGLPVVSHAHNRAREFKYPPLDLSALRPLQVRSLPSRSAAKTDEVKHRNTELPNHRAEGSLLAAIRNEAQSPKNKEPGTKNEEPTTKHQEQRTKNKAPAVLVVVLGSGFNPDPKLPANSKVESVFLARLLEGVRVYRSHPNVRLFVSVSNPNASVESKQEFLRDMADILNLDPERIELMSEAESTADEAKLTARLHRQGEQVVIATSAGHMPRAVKLFTAAGLDPVAAPTDYEYLRKGSPKDKALPQWIPSHGGNESTRSMLYESLASLQSL